ncbi:hypothetical protein Hdeb2414_s0022g00612621 [Helianthus debilis subsp. tardiflorus]
MRGCYKFWLTAGLRLAFLHWCQVYLYDLVSKKIAPQEPKVSYFNIHKITGKECETNFASVKEHLLSVYKLHKGPKFFLAPFFSVPIRFCLSFLLRNEVFGFWIQLRLRLKRIKMIILFQKQ